MGAIQNCFQITVCREVAVQEVFASQRGKGKTLVNIS